MKLLEDIKSSTKTGHVHQEWESRNSTLARENSKNLEILMYVDTECIFAKMQQIVSITTNDDRKYRKRLYWIL